MTHRQIHNTHIHYTLIQKHTTIHYPCNNFKAIRPYYMVLKSRITVGGPIRSITFKVDKIHKLSAKFYSALLDLRKNSASFLIK